MCIFIINDIALLIFSSKIVNKKFQEINLLDWFATNVFVRAPVNQKKYRCSSSFPHLFSSSLLEYSQLRDFSNLRQLWTSSLLTVNLENILSVDHDRKCFLFLVFNPLQVWEVLSPFFFFFLFLKFVCARYLMILKSIPFHYTHKPTPVFLRVWKQW